MPPLSLSESWPARPPGLPQCVGRLEEGEEERGLEEVAVEVLVVQ